MNTVLKHLELTVRRPDVARFDEHGLDLREVLEALGAALAPDARLLVAAERQLWRVDVVVVDVDVSGLQTRRNTMCAHQVSGT